MKYMEQVEDKERIFEYSTRAAEVREAAPQGLFSTIVQGLDLSKAITEISLDYEFFDRFAATVSMEGDLRGGNQRGRRKSRIPGFAGCE